MFKITTPLLFAFFFITTGLQGQLWQQKTGLGTNNGRHHPVTWSIGDYGYLLTGTKNSSTASKDFYRYDAASDTWQQLSDFPGAARSFSIGAAYNGKGYIGFGMMGSGAMLNDLWSYDTTSENWTQLASCPCQGRRHPTFSINEAAGKIYVGKGDNGNNNLSDWWEYDIATDQWTQRPNFPNVARHHPFHFSIGNYTYTGLGHGPNIYSDLYRYDPSDHTWQKMANAPGARVAGTQFSYDGYGFVLSGDGATHGATNPSIFWGYNPAADAWITLPPHPGISLWAPGSFIIDGILYFTGGQNRQNGNLESALWSFDLKTTMSTIEHPQLAFNVYPNPTSDELHIIAPQSLSKASVKIYSVDGNLVYERAFEEVINMESLSPGIYILELTSDSKAVSRKKVVKR